VRLATSCACVCCAAETIGFDCCSTDHMKKVWAAADNITDEVHAQVSPGSELYDALLVTITVEGRALNETSRCERVGDMFSLVGVLGSVSGS
jgi:hypothetical protein